MTTALRAARAVLVLLVLTGILYPLGMTALAQLTMGDKADGSLVEVDGRPVGSSLIGQAWDGPAWFYGRPSATDNDAASSGGSNLGPNSQELADQIAQRAQRILALESPATPGLAVADIPPELLTASASGLDPHISPAAAAFQAPRIAAEHGMSVDEVFALIDDHTEGRTLGLLGEPRVNVLGLNLALGVASET